MEPSDFELVAEDQYRLAATAFSSKGPARGGVLINSATGVKRSYYAKFASFLASRGFLVLTFDYRGIGGSRPARLRGFPARMRDWAELDSESALRWLLQRTPATTLVGHSFGGQALGLMPSAPRLRAALLVGAQSAYWRHWGGLSRAGLWALWHVLIPGLTRLLGYLPGQALGGSEDLPKGVAGEWAAWGRLPRYAADGDGGALGRGFAALSIPLRAYSFEDDRFAPESAVEGLLELYSSAPSEHVHLTPAELGRPIGHWGFFRERQREPLWLDATAWLESHL